MRKLLVIRGVLPVLRKRNRIAYLNRLRVEFYSDFKRSKERQIFFVERSHGLRTKRHGLTASGTLSNLKLIIDEVELNIE
jgi:hypothetical protein